MVKRGILLLAASALAPAPLSAQTVEDRARAAAEASRAKTSDSDAIQQNYLTPGLAGQPISTVDNSLRRTRSRSVGTGHSVIKTSPR